MNLFDLLFYFFALIIVGSALVVVFSKNIVHSAFSLLFTLFGIAAIYVLLNADFLAIVQLIVYIGGILVLIIFGVMLTHKVTEIQIKTNNISVLPATIVVGAFLGLLLGPITRNSWYVTEPKNLNNTILEIGSNLLTNYMIPFQIAGILLLIALIGSVMIARKSKREEK